MDPPKSLLKTRKRKKYECPEPGCTKRTQGWTVKKAMEAHVRVAHPKPLPEEPSEESSSEDSEDEVSTGDEIPPEVETPLTQDDDDPMQAEQPTAPAEPVEESYTITTTPAVPLQLSEVSQAPDEPQESEHNPDRAQEPSDKPDEPQDPENKRESNAQHCTWATTGDLRIPSCEKVCQFCPPGTPPFSKATVLRSHVRTKHVNTGHYPELNVLVPEAKSFTGRTPRQRLKSEFPIQDGIVKKETTPVNNHEDFGLADPPNLAPFIIASAGPGDRATTPAPSSMLGLRADHSQVFLPDRGAARPNIESARDSSTQEELQGIANQLNVLVESWLTVGNVMTRVGELMRNFSRNHPHMKIDNSEIPDFKCLLEHGQQIGTFVRTLQGIAPDEEEPNIRVESPEPSFEGLQSRGSSALGVPGDQGGPPSGRINETQAPALATTGHSIKPRGQKRRRDSMTMDADHIDDSGGVQSQGVRQISSSRKQFDMYEDVDDPQSSSASNARDRMMALLWHTGTPHRGHGYGSFSSSGPGDAPPQALHSRIRPSHGDQNDIGPYKRPALSSLAEPPQLQLCNPFASSGDGLYRNNLGETIQVKGGKAQQVYWSKIG